MKWFMKRCHAAFVPEHVPPATLANNASPLVILAVLHEELTKRGDRVYTQVSQLTNGDYAKDENGQTSAADSDRREIGLPAWLQDDESRRYRGSSQGPGGERLLLLQDER